MASIKISELEEVVTLSESDTLPITNEGDTKQVAISKLGDILATKEYVDKTISESADMGFTPIIVESLPTENIQTNTIYMVLGEDGKDENIYEEWMYINNTWEQIGSTKIDLSGYATEEYVNNITSKQPKMYEKSQTFNNNIGDGVVQQVAGALFSPLITGMINDIIDNGIDVYFKINYKSTYATDSFPIYLFLNSEVKRSSNYTFSGIYCNKDSIYVVTFTCSGSWMNNEYTCSGGKYSIVLVKNQTDYLSKTNTTEYIPTANYHPSTKKYVDDAITSAITTALESDY